MAAAAAAAAGHRHKHGRKPIPAKVVTSIIDGLKQVYFHKVCGGVGQQEVRDEGERDLRSPACWH